MTVLPRKPQPERWRSERDKADKQHGSSKHPQRQFELHRAAQINRELKDESMSNTYQVRSWLDAVHSISDRAENGINFFLDKLEQSGQSGWSPETLHMIHLKNNARTLRQLADRMDKELEQMTAGYVPFLVAAE